MPRSITIIGGGLAGLTLGIGLRRRGIAVTILEAGHYPRHRVCGEFISGLGQDTLTNLHLLEVLLAAGAQKASTAAFFLQDNATPAVRRLERDALCISRFRLDSVLAEAFRKVDGEIKENTRADLSQVPEGVVRTSGRRPHAVENGVSWFGLKVHARNLPLLADLEMHAFRNGYVGVCRLPENEVNICGLFFRSRNEAVSHLSSFSSSSSVPIPIPPGSALYGRLAAADLDRSSFCSVAGLSLKPQRAAALPECCLGDALTMTPPVTGNGMSMAFESAELAIEPLTVYARGEISWDDAKQQVARACDDRFTSRLRWARWLQWMMISSLFQNQFGHLALRSHVLWNMFFRRTRAD